MKQRLWYTLCTLTGLGRNFRVISTSTIELAKILGISQQTVSRQLMELEKAGYIEKNASFKGIEAKITEKGLEELRRIYVWLKIFMESTPSTITIEGSVFSGLGEGAYYVSQKEYKRQFEQKLGFTPYPGTLNLKLSLSEIIKKKELESYPPILVQGFKRSNRIFGDVKCYQTTINNEVKGAAIIIARTHHNSSTMEVIAPVQLRTRFNLKDGDRATLRFFTSPQQEQ